jgi:hypothetical protein
MEVMRLEKNAFECGSNPKVIEKWWLMLGSYASKASRGCLC